MARQSIATMTFARIYPLYLQKVEKKGRNKEEVDQVITWLTGYSQEDLEDILLNEVDVETFFRNAPEMNTRRSLITGVICGVRIEEIEDPLMREVRYLDKLIDELAKGRPMEKVLRETIIPKSSKGINEIK